VPTCERSASPEFRQTASSSPPAGTAFLNGIDVRINGSEPLHFGFDTGAAVDFFITQEKAAQLELPVTGHRAIRTSDRRPSNKADEANIVRAERLQVAGHTFFSAEGVVAADSHLDGSLGITLFRDVELTLDYPHDRLSISDDVLPPPNGHDVIAYTNDPNATFRPLRVSPTVRIKLAGHELPALMDTGARGLNADVVVPTELAATLPLGPTETDTVIADAHGHQFPSRTAKLNGDLVLGDIVLHNPAVLVSDWLGFIDLARMCNRLILTIDQRNHRLRVAMPDSPASP
jgi:predicted aspartyl protease